MRALWALAALAALTGCPAPLPVAGGVPTLSLAAPPGAAPALAAGAPGGLTADDVACAARELLSASRLRRLTIVRGDAAQAAPGLAGGGAWVATAEGEILIPFPVVVRTAPMRWATLVYDLETGRLLVARFDAF